MKTMWIVIDVGCHECGVGSETVGAYATLEEAETAVVQCDERTGRWRDGGQTYAEIFAVDIP